MVKQLPSHVHRRENVEIAQPQMRAAPGLRVVSGMQIGATETYLILFFERMVILDINPCEFCMMMMIFRHCP